MADQTSATDRLLTTTQVAELFQVCNKTIRNWVKRGLLPAVRPTEGVVRFRREDVATLRNAAVSGGDAD